MSLITIISIILIALAIADCITDNLPKFQNDIYRLAFATTYFLFTIKYYYGPDIWSYVPLYDNMPTIVDLITQKAHLPGRYEAGFELFLSTCRSIGCSFWAMTAVISTIYFYAIQQILQFINRRRTFALMIIVLLDCGLIYAMLRQCLSVAFFLLTIIAIQKKHTLPAILFALGTIAFHKSGIFIIIPTLLFVGVQQLRISQYHFGILSLLLIALLFIPLNELIVSTISIIDLGSKTELSITHHLELGRTIQTVFILYLLALLCLNQWTVNRDKSKIPTIQIAAILGLTIIIILYRYYYILNRLRPFFTPIIAVYIIHKIQYYTLSGTKLPYANLIKQAITLFCFMFVTHTTYTFEVASRQFNSKLYNRSTVFNLLTESKADIIQRQMSLAKLYWDKDFMADDTNRIKPD